MKSVLISIQPKWCELIASGKKTVEVRKTRPKIDTPFKCYIYCTNSSGTLHSAYDGLHYHKSYIGKNDGSCIGGKVIGEFVCDWIESTPLWRLKGNTGFLAKRTEREEKLPQMACLSLDEIYRYILNENKPIYGWHIKDLVIYDKPKELSEFINYDRCPYGGLIDCNKCGEHHCLKRPPQSWCYVDSIE